MIDIENSVFNTVASTLRTELLSTYPKMKIYGEYVEYPEDFPCVSLWCTDNYTHLSSRELGTTAEKYADMIIQTTIIINDEFINSSSFYKFNYTFYFLHASHTPSQTST